MRSGALATATFRLLSKAPSNLCFTTLPSSRYVLGTQPLAVGMQESRVLLALQLGKEKVHQFIGHEPSGQRFNAFVLDEDGQSLQTGSVFVSRAA